MDENLKMWENTTLSLEKRMNTNEETINEARKSTVRRASLGAMYGFLMGAAFVVVAAFINVWLHPELPMGVEGTQAVTRWLLIDT